MTGPERESLRAIWEGYRATAVRDAVAAGDPGLGCWECGRAAASGNRASSLAADFDRYQPEPERGPKLLDFALSNRCNLECVMCNGGLSSSIRKNRDGRPPLPPAYDDRFFDELAELLPAAQRTQFKGGEPFLMPESRRVWDLLLDRVGPLPEVSVTTNGTVWSEAVAHYVEALAMEVFVSVDAMDPDVLRSIRTGIDPVRFWRNVDRFQSAAERTGQPLNLMFCLMAQNWRELRPFLDEADQRGVIPHIIWVDGPRDVSLTTLPREALAEVQAAWAEDPGPARPSAASARIWAEATTRVARQATEPVPAANAVAVRPPTRRVPAPERHREARQELEATCRPGLVEVEYRDEIVQSVRTQPWAEAIDPESWIGSGLEELPTLLAVSSGALLRSNVEALGVGSHRLDLWLEADPPIALIGYYLPEDHQRTSTLLLGAADAEHRRTEGRRAIRV